MSALPQSSLTQGLLLSLAAVLLWGIDAVVYRYAAATLHVNPVVFSCLALFVGSLVLIIIAGSGSLGVATLRQPLTWVYGIFQLFLNVTATFAFIYMPATEVTLLARFAIILSLFTGWLFFSRAPSWSDGVGSLLILAGLGIIVVSLPDEYRFVGLFWMFLNVCCNLARTIIAEIHPQSTQAQSIRDRCRVTGVVLYITSFTVATFFAGLAILKTHIPETVAQPQILHMLPSLADFTHLPTLCASILFGATIVPSAMYFYFYGTKVAKTENFMIVAAFTGAFTFVFEWLASLMGLVDIRALSQLDLAAGLLIISGAVFMIYMRMQRLQAVKKARG